MKKICLIMLSIFCIISIIACSKENSLAVELMGAGDKIHDTYTFANIGTKLRYDGNNSYTIYGSVESLNNEKVKTEFEINENISHVVAIKLSAVETKVEKNDVEVFVDGVENFDAEHLNGSSFTYILLVAKQGAEVEISVKWNKNVESKTYKIKFDNNLELK